MLVPILIALTVVFWVGFVSIYFRIEIYEWFDSRWGPQSRPVKSKRGKRRMYD